MLDYIYFGEPGYFSINSVLLFFLLGFLGWLVSPFNAMRRAERHGLLMVYPPLVTVYWLEFQVRLISLDQHIHFYPGPYSVHSWVANSILCLFFGAACSFAIWRSVPGRRIYGGCCLALFLLFSLGLTGLRPIS